MFLISPVNKRLPNFGVYLLNICNIRRVTTNPPNTLTNDKSAAEAANP